MKRTKIYIAVSTLLITGAFSCKKGDDLYISPSSPIKATPSTLLSGIEVGTFNNLEGGMVKTASIFIQQNSGVKSPFQLSEVYAPTESEMDNYWNGLYLNMKNAQLLIDDFGPANPYYKGIGEVVLTLNLGLATDLWGDVPFSEALKGNEKAENLTPKFDSQQSILAAIQTMLDDAIVNLAKPEESNGLLPGSDDFIYNGDVTAWTKLAYTLKARYYSRLSKKPGFDPNVMLNSLSQGISDTTGAEDCYAKHGSGGSEWNQWGGFLNGNAGTIVASQVFVDSLGNKNDPRTAQYFKATAGSVVGNPLGSLNNAAPWGPYLSDPSKNIVLVSVAEAKFLEAEAKVRLGDASAYITLNEAIRASVREVTGGANSGTSVAKYVQANTNLNAVILEKWKALFTEPVEAYAAYRITGFPKLKVNPIGSLPYIPKRYPTAQGERVSNPNAPTPSLGTPVWYAE